MIYRPAPSHERDHDAVISAAACSGEEESMNLND
jgi:hypothetical protein